jgi:hypothetical protein
MTVHFLHIGKTGGTAIGSALDAARLAYWEGTDPTGYPASPYGRIELHRHDFKLSDLPAGDHAVFFVRDPVSRMVSGFYSRLHKGQPRYRSDWNPREQAAFEAFATPQQLANALASGDPAERAQARAAMRGIRHLRYMQRFTGPPAELAARFDQIAYIGRQETLDADWEQLKQLLGLPRGVMLPTDPVVAHRRTTADDTTLDAAAIATLRRWYARDYELVAFCDGVRAARGWGVASGRPPRLASRLRLLLEKTRARRAFAPES